MIAIERYFENPFADKTISAEELRQFTEDHLGKLTTQTLLPDELKEALLDPTEAAFAGFDAKLSTRTTLQAAQEGDTITKDEVVQLFRSTVRQREGRIRDKLGKDSGPYAEFFPRGLTEIHRARVGQLSALLERMIAAADKHKAALGPELLAELKALKAKFASARDGQVEAKGELAQARAELAAARTLLEQQLSRNVLTLAMHHLGAPERAVDYFTQALLEDPTRNHEDEVAKPPVA